MVSRRQKIGVIAVVAIVVVIILVAASWPTPPTKTLAEKATIRAGDLVGSWAETVSPYENPTMLGNPPPSGISSYSMVDFESLTSDINKTLHVNVFLMVFNTTSQAVDYYWSVWHKSSLNLPAIGNLSQMYNDSSIGQHPAYSLVFQQGKVVCWVNGWYPVFYGNNAAWIYSETAHIGMLQSQKIAREIN